MKIIEIDQRSEMWKTWREGGVGASECATVMGLSRYKTPYQLWEIKTNRAFPDVVNSHMQRGIDNEDKARELFNKEIGNIFVPQCGEHEKHACIIASFDGVSLDGKEIVEIKCPASCKMSNILFDKNLKLLKEEYYEYWVQVQHQLCVNEKAEKGYLVAYFEDKIEYMTIEPDKEFISKIEAEIPKFWISYVMGDKEPPLDGKDYAYCEDKKAIELATQIVEREAFIKKEQESVKAMRSELFDNYCDDGNMIIGNVVKIVRVETTRIDYKRACEDHEIYLEPYKKTTIGSYRMTPIK